MATDHVLYRFYGHAGQLLYIGITRDPSSRWGKHREDKPWWFEVQRIEIERFPDRVAVLKAERQAIESEGPRYNITHNRGTPVEPNRPLDRDRLIDLLAEELVELQAKQRLLRTKQESRISHGA